MEGEIKDSDIAVIMNDYMKMGFDEEALNQIRKDLEYGIDVNVVRSYATVNTSTSKMKVMSKIAKKGIDEELAEKIVALETETLKLISKMVEKDFSFEDLKNLIKDCHRTHQIQMAINEFLKSLSKKKSDELKEVSAENVVPEPETNDPVQEEEQPETVKEEDTPEPVTETEEPKKAASEPTPEMKPVTPAVEQKPVEVKTMQETIVQPEKSKPVEEEPISDSMNQPKPTEESMSKESSPALDPAPREVIVHEKPVFIQTPASEPSFDHEKYLEQMKKNMDMDMELSRMRMKMADMEEAIRSRERAIHSMKETKKSKKGKKYRKHILEMQERLDQMHEQLLEEKRKRLRMEEERAAEEFIQKSYIDKLESQEISKPLMTTVPIQSVQPSPVLQQSQIPPQTTQEQQSSQAVVSPTPMEATEQIHEQNEIHKPEKHHISQVEEEKKPEKPVSDYFSNLQSIPGYQAMLRFADGTIVPVDVEKPSGVDRKAFASIVGRRFGKKSPQNALVRQLINKKLSSSQLREIKKAVQYKLADRDLKDLIDSDLPAEEMAGIIDVVLANRGAVTAEGGAGA